MPARIALQLLGLDTNCHQGAEQQCDYEWGKGSHDIIFGKPAPSRKNRRFNRHKWLVQLAIGISSALDRR